MKPTYEQLEQKLQAAENEIAQLKRLLKAALERIAELEAQINRNSKNSSKPPSTDQKGNTSANNRKKREPHSGKSRPLFPPERIDRQVDCTQDICPDCQSPQLHQLKESPFIWQQVELPQVEAIVTQFNCQKYFCNTCGHRSVARLPEGISLSAFGPKLMALVATLTGRFHLAKREALLLIQDLYGIELSEGSIINIEESVTEALKDIYERIHNYAIKGITPRHFDETPWRDSGKHRYIWLATTALAAFYRIDPHRSQEAFFKVIGDHTKQPSVTDRYGAYNALDGPHQYCLAHLIRDFHAFAEQSGENGKIGGGIENELRIACRIQGRWREGEITQQQRGVSLFHSKRRLRELLIDGLAFGNGKLANLCDKLIDEFEHLWQFASIKGMEPTNNMAERDLRKLVLWRKKSYGTRSEKGQRFVERISSVVETIKKNGKNVLSYLEEALNAFYRGEPSPFINPEANI
jgi:transposase